MTRNAAKPGAAGNKGTDSSSAWHVAAEANRRLGQLLGKHWRTRRKLLEKKEKECFTVLLDCRVFIQSFPSTQGHCDRAAETAPCGYDAPARQHCPEAEAPCANPPWGSPRAVAAGLRQ